jgi:glutamate-1-semialdehyde 2,1-aminomutase
MKTVAIVQARFGSTRFPGKVLRPLAGRPLIELLLARLSRAKQVDEIVLATSSETQDDPLAAHAQKLGFAVFRGSEADVLDRYHGAAQWCHADVVVRITGDCPLVDPALVDSVVSAFKSSNVDYASNADPPTYPDGLDVEVFTTQALQSTWQRARRPMEREHVTVYMRESGQFRVLAVRNDVDLSGARLTVDEPPDLEVVAAVLERFSPRLDFTWQEVMQLAQREPTLFAANRHLIRNQGASMSTGQKLWKRAKRIIPGGNMLLSKRAEMFLPDQWPAYFSKAAGCKVWDLDGREYVDMSIMGIGTNTLGYGHPEVDAAVRATIPRCWAA